MADDIREMRAAAMRAQPGLIPSGSGRSQAFAGTLRAQKVEKDGQQYYLVEGYASVTERGYEMWDMFGSYTEVVAGDAFDKTLSASPDVAFLVNHRGVTMARTVSGSLELSVDSTGLKVSAYLNPKRQDVNDLVTAIEDGDVTEMSFAFVIDRGKWSPDYTEYRIEVADLDRGDVSAVNYGANPHTSIAARSAEILESLDRLPAGAARAAMERLTHRADLVERSVQASEADDERTEVRKEPEPEKLGRSVGLINAILAAEAE